jgi:hypothetical protein
LDYIWGIAFKGLHCSLLREKPQYTPKLAADQGFPVHYHFTSRSIVVNSKCIGFVSAASAQARIILPHPALLSSWLAISFMLRDLRGKGYGWNKPHLPALKPQKKAPE